MKMMKRSLFAISVAVVGFCATVHATEQDMGQWKKATYKLAYEMMYGHKYLSYYEKLDEKLARLMKYDSTSLYCQLWSVEEKMEERERFIGYNALGEPALAFFSSPTEEYKISKIKTQIKELEEDKKRSWLLKKKKKLLAECVADLIGSLMYGQVNEEVFKAIEALRECEEAGGKCKEERLTLQTAEWKLEEYWEGVDAIQQDRHTPDLFDDFHYDVRRF